MGEGLEIKLMWHQGEGTVMVKSLCCQRSAMSVTTVVMRKKPTGRRVCPKVQDPPAPPVHVQLAMASPDTQIHTA